MKQLTEGVRQQQNVIHQCMVQLRQLENDVHRSDCHLETLKYRDKKEGMFFESAQKSMHHSFQSFFMNFTFFIGFKCYFIMSYPGLSAKKVSAPIQ